MKISINDKTKSIDTLKGPHSKNFLIISSNYTVEFLYKILKRNQKIINNKDDNNETLLSYAIKRKNMPIIDLLLTSPLLDYTYQNLQGNSYLHLSVIYELEQITRTLIQKGIDINKKNADGNTALHYAYSVNNYNIIILLLQNKIDFTINNNQGLIAEEIKPNSLKKDDLIINKNNQINKSIIIDWDDNKINIEKINSEKEKENIIYKVKNRTPLILKNIRKTNVNVNRINIFNKKNVGVYKKGNSQENNIQRTFSDKDLDLFDYHNTEKNDNKTKHMLNNLFDSKQETGRKNIFESKVLPSNHQINCHICDLNYLNNFQKNQLNSYKKISKSQYFIKAKKNIINNFSPYKVNNRYEIYDSKIESDRGHYFNSTRYKDVELIPEMKIDNNNDSLKDEDNIKQDKNITDNEDNKNIIINNDNNNSINQKSTNDSVIQNNLDLHHFLSKIKMEKYFNKLQKNGFDDINLLISQSQTDNPITDVQLKEIGINKIGDRARILIRLEENANNFGFSLPNEVYYICENINNIDINEDNNINKLFQWLNTINLGEYLDNFLINGYYSIELLLFQMISKNPLNDDMLKNEIEINKVGHRSRLLNKLIDDAKDIRKRLKKRAFFFTNGREAKSCDCIVY